MIALKQNHKVRMIGLTTAIANGTDVAEWFNVHPYYFYNFKPSCRPVPVSIHFSGFSEKAYCPRMNTMNKPAFIDIKKHSDNKSTLIFVSSRRQTRLTALDLISFALNENNEKSMYLKCSQEEIDKWIKRI